MSETIKFSPSAAGSVTGSLAVTTDTTGRDLSISLTGTGVSTGSAQLSASPSPVNFGSVTAGSNLSISVTLTDVGGATASVSSASFSGPGFSVSGLSTPFNLNSGQQLNFTVGFSPTAAGNASGNILLKDANGTTLLNLPMSGTATSAIAHSVDLNWNASTSTVTGYHVYRGQVSGGPYALLSGSLLSGTSYTDSDVVAGSSYFYVVTAVDTQGLESGFSNEAPASVPFP